MTTPTNPALLTLLTKPYDDVDRATNFNQIVTLCRQVLPSVTREVWRRAINRSVGQDGAPILSIDDFLQLWRPVTPLELQLGLLADDGFIAGKVWEVIEKRDGNMVVPRSIALKLRDMKLTGQGVARYAAATVWPFDPLMGRQFVDLKKFSNERHRWLRAIGEDPCNVKRYKHFDTHPIVTPEMSLYPSTPSVLTLMGGVLTTESIGKLRLPLARLSARPELRVTAFRDLAKMARCLLYQVVIVADQSVWERVLVDKTREVMALKEKLREYGGVLILLNDRTECGI